MIGVANGACIHHNQADRTIEVGHANLLIRERRMMSVGISCRRASAFLQLIDVLARPCLNDIMIWLVGVLASKNNRQLARAHESSIISFKPDCCWRGWITYFSLLDAAKRKDLISMDGIELHGWDLAHSQNSLLLIPCQTADGSMYTQNLQLLGHPVWWHAGAAML